MAKIKDAPKIYRNVKWGEIARAAGNNRFSGKPVNPAVVAAYFVSADARRAGTIVNVGAVSVIGGMMMSMFSTMLNNVGSMMNGSASNPYSFVYKSVAVAAAAYAVDKYSKRDLLKNQSTMEASKSGSGQKEFMDLLEAIKQRDEFILEILKEKPALRTKLRGKFQQLTSAIKSASSKKSVVLKDMKKSGVDKKDIDYVNNVFKMAKDGVASFLPNLEKNNTGK